MKCVTLLVLLCVMSSAFAQSELESDWLNAKSGSKESLIDAEVINVTNEEDRTMVDVNMDVSDIDNIESIVVIGKRPEKPDQIFKLVQPVEWLHIDENKPYGLRFYVKGIKDFEFRIQMKIADELK